MTAHAADAKAFSDAGQSVTAAGRHNLHHLDVERTARRVVIFSPSMLEIERLLRLWEAEVGPSASADALRRMMSANPDIIRAIALKKNFDWANPMAQGFFAILPLSLQGHLALLDGSFDPRDPAEEHLVGQHERAAAIYFAAIYAPGQVAGGVGLAFEQVCAPLRRDADLYSRLATFAGQNLMPQLGFEPIAPTASANADTLYVFRRVARDEERPLYDSYPSPASKYAVGIVRDLDDYSKMLSIRSSVFVGEQICPYAEEFDGNDLTATHLIGYIDDEPAATIRIRLFAGFAKLERVAVRREHRRSEIAFVIIRAAREFCRMKGYRTIYGHVQKRYVAFWKQVLGARIADNAREFSFSDFDYVEMIVDLDEHPGAISMATDPLILLRPEGRWHKPGVLDRSASRPVTRPSCRQASPAQRTSARPTAYGPTGNARS
ncbi:GNAT family N-acetyltransferase [Methylobacterium sp. J-030]|uniref:GNAT family N-acetyltransferase n=1 Tax=Methylobacterium sp. J-030 TaxID=2836627 RepID=UPI001FBB14A1|nr:GNAT family N-acetyltransferase [Methylobacterium sp. J-030]MCJ2067782.1 GNAT family N-acetyltransferase [Methylobacterium sp. J-030]